jgi:hypothetical protein
MEDSNAASDYELIAAIVNVYRFSAEMSLDDYELKSVPGSSGPQSDEIEHFRRTE